VGKASVFALKIRVVCNGVWLSGYNIIYRVCLSVLLHYK
jgi:hypothetical protein